MTTANVTIGTLSNITLSGSGSGWANNMGTVSITGGNGGTYAYSNNIWTTASPTVVTVGSSPPSLKVSGDADIDGSLRVGGVDLTHLLGKIQDRLAILVPDPDRLEKYEALRQAYDHYKTLEALCVKSDDADPQG